MTANENNRAWGHWMMHGRNVPSDADIETCASCGCAVIERYLYDGLREVLDPGEVAVWYRCPTCGACWLVLFERIEREDRRAYAPFKKAHDPLDERHFDPSRRVLTDQERHDALDALAANYSGEPDAHPLIYAHRDDPWFTARDLDNLMVPLALHFVRDHDDWREAYSDKESDGRQA